MALQNKDFVEVTFRSVSSHPKDGENSPSKLLASFDALNAAIILSAETVFAGVFGFLLLGERLTASGLAGAALIIACLVAVQLTPKKVPSPDAGEGIFGGVWNVVS